MLVSTPSQCPQRSRNAVLAPASTRSASDNISILIVPDDTVMVRTICATRQLAVAGLSLMLLGLVAAYSLLPERSQRAVGRARLRRAGGGAASVGDGRSASYASEYVRCNHHSKPPIFPLGTAFLVLAGPFRTIRVIDVVNARAALAWGISPMYALLTAVDRVRTERLAVAHLCQSHACACAPQHRLDLTARRRS